MAKKVYIDIYKGILDSQHIKTGKDFMIGRAFFYLTVKSNNPDDTEGSKTHALVCEVRQPQGEDYEENPIEVIPPAGFRNKINYLAFQEIIESYFRNMVGSSARGINIQNAKNVTIKNYVHTQFTTGSFEIPESGGGWQFD